MMTVVNYRWDETSDGYEFTTEWMVARIADGDGDGGYVDIPADAFDAASSKARRDDDSGIQFTVGGGGLWVESKIGCQKLATYR